MDMSVELDEHFIDVMAFATQPPAIVRPFFDDNNEYAQLLESLEFDLRRSRVAFQKWLDETAEMKARVQDALFANSKTLTEIHIDRLVHYALIMEKKAENSAIELRKREKQNKKIMQRFNLAVGKSKGRPVEEVFTAASDQWREEIEIYLDVALFFRAMAANFDPGQEIVFLAKDGNDIDEYFAGIGLR